MAGMASTAGGDGIWQVGMVSGRWGWYLAGGDGIWQVGIVRSVSAPDSRAWYSLDGQ